MTDWNIEIILDIIRECGKISMRYYKETEKEFKSDNSIVTIADREIEAFIKSKLESVDQKSYIIGEETVSGSDEDYLSNALKETAWIIDPIDGTAPYANGLSTWGISLAVIKEGKLQEGVIYLPALEEIFISDNGRVLFGETDSPDFNWDSDSLSPIEPISTSIDKGAIISLSQKITKYGKFRGVNPVQTVCSCVYSIANLLKNNYHAYVATVKLWDIAAGLVLLSNLGLYVKRIGGGKITLEVNDEYYHLEPSSKYRWSLKGHAVIAVNEKIADYVLNHTELP